MSENEFKSVLEQLKATTESLTPEQWEERDRAIADANEKKRREEVSSRWKATKESLIDRGLAERHLEALFRGALKPTTALEGIDKFTDDGLYILSGNVGCGKTLAAHAWLLDAKHVEPLLWTSGGVRMITAAWFARASRYGEDKFEALAKTKKLVIDDLGVEFNDSKGSFQVDLDELLDLRWRAKNPTVITTNVTKEEFKDRYGLRVYDRARGSSWANVKGESMRTSR